ncbi:hypothetical protein GCM10011487_60780 [Steroidobacter agaridevorans]|uniref:Uncharacterized protein n=1 Tax=Steroidobacter agaridevorans TaxID=2695856 RepID=A0A829YMZ3_9GAMM|nr:hypothetical protein GCM10011487_60780 [Steroidobacter agaridevorans]
MPPVKRQLNQIVRQPSNAKPANSEDAREFPETPAAAAAEHCHIERTLNETPRPANFQTHS